MAEVSIIRSLASAPIGGLPKQIEKIKMKRRLLLQGGRFGAATGSEGRKAITLFGRPRGNRIPKLSLRPVADCLARILGESGVRFVGEVVGRRVTEAVVGGEDERGAPSIRATRQKNSSLKNWKRSVIGWRN